MSSDAHKKDTSSGLTHLWNATRNTSRGLRAAIRNESAFRQALGATIVLSPFAVWLGTTGVERAMLVASLLLMLMVELLNSGIETAIDRVGPEHHHLSGLAKDIASAAVGIAILNVIVVWVLILWPHYGWMVAQWFA